MSAEEANDATLIGGDIVYTRIPLASGASSGDAPIPRAIQAVADQSFAVATGHGDESRVLALVDGRRTVAEVIRMSPLPSGTTLQHLRALCDRGVLAPLKTKTSTGPLTPLAAHPNVVVIDTRYRDRADGAERSATRSGPPSAVSYLPTALSSHPSNGSFGAAEIPANGTDTAVAAGSTPFRLGSYEVATRIGQGGMGTVYVCRKAWATGVQRLFALKVVRQHADQQELAVRSLMREARVGALLSHPNIQGVVDVGTYKAQPFLILDYIEGVSLADMLTGDRRPPAPIVVAIILDVLRGLDRAHGLSDDDGRPLEFVHCDVSPPNILVGADGIARLTDFGSCRVLSEEGPNRPDPLKLGKPSFMAPEQLCAEPLDRRTDIFAMGATMFAALTGQEAFGADSYQQVVLNVLRKRVPPPSELGAPACFDDICRRALSRPRDGRYATAEEMAQALLKSALADGLLASPGEVAQYVRREFGEVLDEQRHRIQSALDGKLAARNGASDSFSGIDTRSAGAATSPATSAPAAAPMNRGADKNPKLAATMILPRAEEFFDGPVAESSFDGSVQGPRAAVEDTTYEIPIGNLGKVLWQRLAQERKVIYASVAFGIALLTLTVLLVGSSHPTKTMTKTAAARAAATSAKPPTAEQSPAH